MDELSAIGVTFPVHAAYYIIAGSTSALDNTTVLKQCFTDSFGDDFILLDINTFVSSTMKEVVAPKLPHLNKPIESSYIALLDLALTQAPQKEGLFQKLFN